MYVEKMIGESNVTVLSVPVSKSQTAAIKKESQQAKDTRQALWIEPRLGFQTLASFFDWNTWHKRCILVKAGVTCGLGWELVTDDDDKEPDADHGRIAEFLTTCNKKEESFRKIAYRSAIDYYHLGNIFTELVRNGKGELGELYHAPAASMRVGNQDESIWQLRYGLQKEFPKYPKVTAGKNSMAHCAGYDPLDDYYGMPEWLPVMATMLLDRNAVSYNTYNFENEFVAKLLIFIKGAKLDKKVKETFKTFLSSEYKGVEKAGKALLLDVDDPNVDIKIEKLQMNTKDLAFTEGRKLSRDEIIEMHGVPPRIMNIMQAGQLGGTGEISGQLKIFRDITINPPKTEMEEYWNNILSNGMEMGKWRLEFKQFDITTALEDAEYLSKIGQDLSDDERREVLGYTPRKDKPKSTPPPPASTPLSDRAGISDRAAAATVDEQAVALVEKLASLRKSLEEYAE